MSRCESRENTSWMNVSETPSEFDVLAQEKFWEQRRSILSYSPASLSGSPGKILCASELSP